LQVRERTQRKMWLSPYQCETKQVEPGCQSGEASCADTGSLAHRWQLISRQERLQKFPLETSNWESYSGRPPLCCATSASASTYPSKQCHPCSLSSPQSLLTVLWAVLVFPFHTPALGLLPLPLNPVNGDSMPDWLGRVDDNFVQFMGCCT